MAMAPCATSSVSFPARPAAAAAASSSSARPRPANAVARAAGGGESGSGAKWWAPLLGWSGKADYIEAPAPAAKESSSAAARGRAFVGGLTEEKARELRSRMAQTESFHDAMYHSAIASRLARSA